MERTRSLLPFVPRVLRQRWGSPWRALSEMEDEMQRWFDESQLLSSESFQGADFVPQCDLRETNKEYVAKFDIPGVKKSDLKIEVDGKRLTVRGERKQEKVEKDEKRYHSETYYGNFLRSFTLPNEINEKKVEAHYEDGVLTIKIPKGEPVERTKEIAIH